MPLRSIYMLVMVLSILKTAAQGNDSSKMEPPQATPSPHLHQPLFSPAKAAKRSAILPGWGQVYNRQIWKLPLVYGALGTMALIFDYNNTWYNRCGTAYTIVFNTGNTADPNIYPDLKGLSANQLLFARNQFRRDRDLTVIFFLLTWGLNVVDATVSAHLKAFDVSSDLSFKIVPALDAVYQTPMLSVLISFNPNGHKRSTNPYVN